MTLATLSWPIISRIPLGGDLAISPHGIGIAAGFALGAWMLIRRARLRGLGHQYVPDVSEAVQRLLGRVAIGAIIGARFFYVLTHIDQFTGSADQFLQAFAIWQGGLTFLGGVTGALVFALPWARKQGWDARMLMDSAFPGIAAGLLLGRVGDLMIGDHLGAPTNFFLGWQCRGDFNPLGGGNTLGLVAPQPYPAGASPTIGCYDVPVHQTALYDFIAALFVLLLILWLERKARFDGFFVAAWVYGYGIVRFAGDFAREDRRFLALTGSQWALLGAAALVTWWLVARRPWERRPWAWDREFDHPWLRPELDDAAVPIASGDPGSGEETD